MKSFFYYIFLSTGEKKNSILSSETTSGEQIPSEDDANVYKPLCVQTSLWTIPKMRETLSHHSFAIWGLLGADTLPENRPNYAKFTCHNAL